MCEHPWCDRPVGAFHHMLKKSVWPEFIDDPDVILALCGPHHVECEQRLLRGQDVTDMYPKRLWEAAKRKVGA